jgi:RimJ/RimL family protein N-acetyltransferase/organic hydroperoxide reductase OsmC/OhrA
MTREHHYALELTWTGNTGNGTASHRAYRRDHLVTAPGAGTLRGSSDPAFRGDATRWNPEQLLVASIAQCHLLWYLALAAEAGVVVTGYTDAPTGTMRENPGGSGEFTGVTLHPRVTIAPGSDEEKARQLHERVGDYCFIARSVNFPVDHQPVVVRATADTPQAGPALPIVTERLTLRAFTPADAEPLASYLGDPDVVRHLLHGPKTAAECRDLATELAGRTAPRVSGEALVLVAEFKGEHIGHLNLTLHDHDASSAEIGWVFHPAVAGQGLATEAAAALMRFGFEHYRLRHVTAQLDPRNTASARLCERLGMTREALLRESWWSKGEWTDNAIYVRHRDDDQN